MISNHSVLPSPILVTGSHRSGSTWVGRILASAPNAFYVHEPLNASFAPYYHQTNALPWYPRLEDAEHDPIREQLKSIISGEFPRIDYGFFRPDRYLRYRALHAFTFWHAVWKQKHFVIKDPFALFGVEWFEKTFDVRTVLLLRHPAAFVASLKVKNWTFDFRHLLRQENLMTHELRLYRDAIRRAVDCPMDIIGQGCLLWNCLTHRIAALAAADSSRILVRHEDLCREPTAGFQDLFSRLGLSWTSATDRLIRKTTATRDSDAVINAWKHRLTPAEIQRVRDETESTAATFYSEEPERWVENPSKQRASSTIDTRRI